MPNEFTNPVFDFELVSKEEASKLRYFEGELLKSRKRVVAEVLEHGKILHDAQSLLANHGNGTFRAWLESVGIGKDSAYRAIESYEAFKDCRNCDNLEVSAIYALAKNEQAKKRAIKLADKGVKVTHAMAQKLIEDAKPKAIPAIKQSAPIPTKGKSYTESSGVPGDPGQFYESTGEDGETDFDGMEAQEDVPGPSRNDTEKPGDSLPIVSVERCPNCAGTKFVDDDFGQHCAKCKHPLGEPAGEVDDDRIAIQRSKTIKTAEALMRAFDDLNLLVPKRSHAEAVIEDCKRLIRIAKEWK